MVSQVFEQHIQKHNPVEHGERLCQKCEQILGQTFANSQLTTAADLSSSSLSSTPSSLSSVSSGQAHHSVHCRSYQVDTLEKRGAKNDILRPTFPPPTPRVQTSSFPLRRRRHPYW